MEKLLHDHLNHLSFPCIMAKSALKRGVVKFHDASRIPLDETYSEIGNFVNQFRKAPEKLHSFIVAFPHMSFNEFEKTFWKTITEWNLMDTHPHDDRVSSDPFSPRFSYSLHAEAFFMLLLHPESPRFARRLPFPALVMNPHRQFEELRAKRIYFKVRNLIRKRDKDLQGFENPMLDDFGRSSEIFQYTGKVYSEADDYMKEFHDNYSSPHWSRHYSSEGLEASGY